MDLKVRHTHELMYSNNNMSQMPGPSVIKTEPRMSPCYSPREHVIRSPPVMSASNGLFSGISPPKRHRPPNDWLTVIPHPHVQPHIQPHAHTNSHAHAHSNQNQNPNSPIALTTSGSSSVSRSPTPGPSPNPGPSCSIPVGITIYPSTSAGYHSPTMSVASYDSCSPGSKFAGEDLSPSSHLSYAMEIGEAPKKKKATSRQQEELCLVCGDRASGYHYNALTCEGCKGFFRRSITKNAVYQCKYGNKCDIDMYMRRKCQECRLKKCLRVGMRPECVVPEYQCAVKRNEKKILKQKEKPSTSTGGPSGSGSSSSSKGQASSAAGPSGTAPTNTTNKLVSPEQEELIHSLVYFQEQYEQPSSDDLEKVFKDVRETHEEGDMKFRQITEMTILTVQLIVEFAKSLPGFDKLMREDQITLLKACSSEVMMLRMARKYDANTDSIVFANNEPYTKDSYSLAGMGETIEDLLRFCRQMCAMKVDNAEYALLTAIVIFSGRPCLLEGWKVEKIQEIYIETLKSYVETRIRPNSTTIFARLLSVLTELRTLGNRNSEMCFALKLKSKALPPFLSEIWDIAP